MKKKQKLIFLAAIGGIAAMFIADKQNPQTQSPQSQNPPAQIAPSSSKTKPITPQIIQAKRGSVDYIFVDKSARFMELYSKGDLVKRYDIALGFAPSGQKTKQGDGKTPAGEYVIDWRNDKSSFYRSLHISYPRPDQVKIAKAEGRNPGGAIMIHGQINGREWQGDKKINDDWTNGCIAVSNNEMDEIWGLVRNGAKIKIVE